MNPGCIPFLQRRLQLPQRMVDVFHRPFPQSAIRRPIKAMIDIVTRFFQQLHSRVNRPSLAASALRRRRVPRVLAIVHCRDLDVVDRLVDLLNRMVPVPDPRWTSVLLQVPARRSQIGKCMQIRWFLGVGRCCRCQSQERKQRKGCRGKKLQNSHWGLTVLWGDWSFNGGSILPPPLPCIGPVCPFFPFFYPVSLRHSGPLRASAGPRKSLLFPHVRKPGHSNHPWVVAVSSRDNTGRRYMSRMPRSCTHPSWESIRVG